MEKNKLIIPFVILAFGIFLMGKEIGSGLESIAENDRLVTVKGLAEKTVPADKVTWPIVSKEVGNDLSELYDRINNKTQIIKSFLLKGGLKEGDININAPEVIDLTAERYSTNDRNYRYNIKSVITVTSKEVDLVRNIIARQGELLKQGVAIINGGYENPVTYEYTAFKDDKSKMMNEAIKNAENTALQFAENSNSRLKRIENASQGQFSIENKDETTPYIKKVRVVTTITYSLKD